MFIIFIRTIILYFTIILVIRLMGKRQLGELQPYELVITIMLANLATLPMADTKLPLLLGIIPTITLLMLKTILVELQIRFPLISRLFDGCPVILIEKGNVKIQNLKNQKMNIADLLEELREKGIFDINDVDFAILECNGSISVFPNDCLSPISKKDLNLNASNKIIPQILYFNGKINNCGLSNINKDKVWLLKQLKNLNAPMLEDLFLVILTSEKKIFFQKYNNDIEGDLQL
ncbi:MAG: DUF421 domain-containing protein [Sarcina sp.]